MTEPAPGEVNLETHTPAPAPTPAPMAPVPVVEPPVVEDAPPADDDPPADAPAGDDPPAPAPRKGRTMVEDLQAERAKRAEAHDRAVAAEARLRDYDARVARGELLAAPPRAPGAPDPAQQAELEETARELGLLKPDGVTLDLEAAARAARAIDKRVQRGLAPLQQQSHAQTAATNIQKAVDFASKYSAEAQAIIRQTFDEHWQLPNGAQMLADPNTAKIIWERALGRAVSAGVLTSAAPTPAPGSPPVIPAPPGGRRTVTPAIALSPKIESIYRDAGIDPAKGYQPPAATSRGGITLE